MEGAIVSQIQILTKGYGSGDRLSVKGRVVFDLDVIFQLTQEILWMLSPQEPCTHKTVDRARPQWSTLNRAMLLNMEAHRIQKVPEFRTLHSIWRQLAIIIHFEPQHTLSVTLLMALRSTVLTACIHHPLCFAHPRRVAQWARGVHTTMRTVQVCVYLSLVHSPLSPSSSLTLSPTCSLIFALSLFHSLVLSPRLDFWPRAHSLTHSLFHSCSFFHSLTSLILRSLRKNCSSWADLGRQICSSDLSVCKMTLVGLW